MADSTRGASAGARARDACRTIAHILPFPAVGGTEHATRRIAAALDPGRFKSIAFYVRGAEPVRAFLAESGLSCAPYDPAVPSYRHGVAYLQKSMTLARELVRQQVDVVHCADLLAAHHAALAGRLARVRVVCHIRNRFDRISRRDRSFLWPVDRFVFVSRNTWRRFDYAVPSSRGVVVYDGIDVGPVDDAVANRRSVEREFQIPAGAPLVGMMARVAPQKDFATLIKAAVRVLQAEPRARFLVAGDNASAEYRQHYQQVLRELDAHGVARSFIFTGYRADIPRLLSALDVFVLSTHWEGLPLVLLEAMAHGKPVVATAVDGIPEIVRDGETGLLAGHRNDEQLAAHLIDVLQHPARARRLGEAGRHVARTCFSAEQFAAGMNAVYAATLGGATT